MTGAEIVRTWLTAPPPPPRWLDGEVQLPFQDLLGPAVSLATDALRARSAHVDLLEPAARTSLERALLERLVEAAGYALLASLRAERAIGGGAYDTFVARMRDGGLSAVFAEHIVLPELVELTLDQWLATSSELLARFAEDRALLGAANAQIDALDPELSDRHDRGRVVMRLRFAGLRWLYKPRAVALESGLERVAQWIARASEHQIVVEFPRVIDQGDYGWVEHVEPAPCADAADARTCFRRLGHVIAFFHWICGGDLHPENVIVRGSTPVVIDPEVAFTGVYGYVAEPHDDCVRRAEIELEASVIGTGMAPTWQEDARGLVSDVSGWANPERVESSRFTRRWIDVGTDAIRLAPAHALLVPTHVPVVGGRPQSLTAHAAEIVAGYRELATLLLARKDDRDAHEALGLLRGVSVRLLFRHTRVYGRVLERLLQPDLLRDRARRDAELARLGRAFPTDGVIAALVRAEARALLRMDVPRFTTTPSSLDVVETDGEPIAGVFRRSGLDRAFERWRDMTPASIERQCDLLWASYCGRFTKDLPPIRSRTRGPRDPVATLLDEADRIAESLCDAAIESSDGSATWIGLEPVGGSDRASPRALRPTFYDGSVGIGMFLAAHAALRESAESRRVARASVGGVRSWLRNAPVGVALGNGAAGTLLAILGIAARLNEPALVGNDGDALAAILAASDPEDDAMGDALGGAAGVVLALLSAFRIDGGAPHLAEAMRWGGHLARVAESSVDAPWKHQSGFGHGRAGVSYALGQLATVTGDRALADVAKRVLEVRCADTSLDPVSARAWCHGAPGRGLVFDGMPIDVDPEIGPDHLCCGVAGRVELMARSDRAALALEAAAWINDRRESGYRFYVRGPSSLTPSLFTGLAGVGLATLRAASPSRVAALLPLR